MVDRYFLPIPKSKAFNFNIHHKNSKMIAFLYIFGGVILSAQVARISLLKQTNSKPATYFLDWNSTEAPKKVKYFA